MFYVIRKNRDNTEEVIGKHRYRDIAEEKCEKEKKRHEMFLGIGGFRRDDMKFYVIEK